MRRTLLTAAAVLLLSMVGCRSSIDLSTGSGQMRFGIQAAKMELWREAQFRFLRAVEMTPNDPMAYNNLAVAYEGIGEYDKAREAYLRALQIDRSNEYIQRNYSRFVEFYSKRNPPEKVKEESSASRSAAPDDEAVASEATEPVEEAPAGHEPSEPEATAPETDPEPDENAPPVVPEPDEADAEKGDDPAVDPPEPGRDDDEARPDEGEVPDPYGEEALR